MNPFFARLWPEGKYIESVWSFVSQQYAQPHRAYHTMTHIRACLDEFERLCPLTDEVTRDVCRIALWFHDVFYEPRAVDNEWRSAVAAANACRTLGRPELVERVKACIMATKHIDAQPTGESVYVVDADLSILGAEPDVFDAYERAIKLEYAHVPEADFCAGRAAILRRILGADHIFASSEFRAVYEIAARANLARSIAALNA